VRGEGVKGVLSCHVGRGGGFSLGPGEKRGVMPGWKGGGGKAKSHLKLKSFEPHNTKIF
jgi:hypothetical protein